MFKYFIIVILLLVTRCAEGYELGDHIVPDTKILGGQEAPDGGFPYQLSLRKSSTSIKLHFCGGSIISTKWALTAAHCTIQLEPSDITVVAGTNSVEEGGSRHEVDKIIEHPSYSRRTKENDMSMIRISDEFIFGPKVGAIALPDEDTPDGTKCTLTGWGYRNNNKELPTKLQMLEVNTISLEKCQSKLQYTIATVTDKNVCTLLEFGKGACQGDSGGPLVCNGKLTGCISWIIPCGQGEPDVYGNVHRYVQWIQETMQS